MADTDEKRFDATPLRRQQSREQGRYAFSQDVVTAAMLLSGLLIIKWFGPGVIQSAAILFGQHLSAAGSLTSSRETFLAEIQNSMGWLAIVLLPILGLLMVAGVLSSASQVGLRILPERIALDWGRVSPLQGLGRIFSLVGLAKLGFGLAKLVAIIAVATMVLWSRGEEVLTCGSLELAALGQFLVQLALDAAMWVAAALLGLAFIDYGFQHWKHEQDLRMTPQEVRDEMKNMQGNPQVAVHRHKIQCSPHAV